ncbi:O-antigen ligase family protein [Arthrobacter sp. K5]|uniref:O-antigen ligase family protein n=1 Tax=Arthrobacter sp. K5 TaxID=2839623 RepID=A0AAU8ETW6_9MICC
MQSSEIAPARCKPRKKISETHISRAGRRKTSAVALAFIIFSEPTLLTANHGLLPAAIVLVFGGLLLTGIPMARVSWWALAPTLFLGIVGVSVAWSILPDESSVGALATLCVLLTSILVAAKVEIHELVQGVIAGVLVVFFLSILMVLIRPDLGLVAETYKYGSLRGIYEHRNQMGYTLTIGVVALLSSSQAWTPRKRVSSLAVLLVLVMGVAWSASSTAIAMCAFGFVLVLALRSIPRSAKRLRPLVVTYYALVAGFGLWLVINQFGEATSLLGRDETLTGRTTIWPYVLEAWTHSPWLGFGWDATWTDASYVGNWISNQINYRVYHAHDSYLDVLIQLGIVGLTTLILCIAVALSRGGAWLNMMFRGLLDVDAVFPSAIICVLAIYSIVETRISHPLGLFLLFYIVIIANPSDHSSRRPFLDEPATAMHPPIAG